MESLSYCRTNKKLEVFAYVIMYNHIHMIVRSDSGDLSGTIRDLKKFTSREIIKRISSGGESRKRWLLKEMAFAARKHCRNSSYQLWTHENHAVELTSNSIIDQRTDYIHRNPVKAGIVENAEDYLYSSARNYCDDYDALIEIDIMQ